MYFEIYQDGSVEDQGLNAGGLLSALLGEWRWRLKSANHEIIASGEGYANKSDCLHAVGLVKGTTALTPVVQR
jgi:uncharacterized protein YegP (UPF0339 family)